MRMDEMQLSLLVNMENPLSVFDEVRATVPKMIPEFDFETLESVCCHRFLRIKWGGPR
jgi:hypothetical protein